jgi:histidine triad (HIT) family protein
MSNTIFDKIISGEIPSFKVWEDDRYLAFLTPFPNTPGFTVVIPKQNQGDYVYDLSPDQLQGLMEATRQVAKLLEKAFDTPRVALIFEGTGVPYVHAKLIPLHGKLGSQTDVWSHHQEFYPEYIGYLTTTEGPRMSDDQLRDIQNMIISKQS